MAGDFDLNPADYAEDFQPQERAHRRLYAPGSHRPRREGCTCPIIENAYGRGIDSGGRELLFVRDERCPYHLSPAAPA